MIGISGRSLRPQLGRSGLVFGRRPYRRRCAHLVFDGFSRRSRNSRGPLIRRRFRCARSSWVAPWAPNRSISLDASSAALCLALLGPIWRASLDELRSACCNNCRIASGFDGRGAGCAFIQLVSSRSRSGYSLKPIALPMPVFGRPRRRFFLLSDIDRMVKICYQKMPGCARGRAQNGGFHHDPKNPQLANSTSNSRRPRPPTGRFPRSRKSRLSGRSIGRSC